MITVATTLVRPTTDKPARGFRAWRAAGPHLLPLASTHTDAWGPGLREAKCLFTSYPDQAIHAFHLCGFHAFNLLSGLLSEICEEDTDSLMIGEIEAEGHVHRHAWGFRAQKARVVSLSNYNALPFEARAIIDVYGGVPDVDGRSRERQEAKWR